MGERILGALHLFVEKVYLCLGKNYDCHFFVGLECSTAIFTSLITCHSTSYAQTKTQKQFK